MILLEYTGVGLIGALGLIFLAKVVMAGILQRNNNYYQDEYDVFDEGGGEDA